MKRHEELKTKTKQNKMLAADSVTLQKQKQTFHEPVLMHEVLEYLAPKQGQSYLDLTAGYGGHAAKVVQLTVSPKQATLVDRDMNAVQELHQVLPECTIVHSDAASFLTDTSDRYDLVLADIGISSPHVDVSNRGFSFMHDGPLDMRMDQSMELTAGIVVNTYQESEIADILYRYGEEKASRRIARKIVASRPIATTHELADIVSSCLGHKKTKHPEARSFQALRVFVNDEINQLKAILLHAPQALVSGGRLGIISFHSLEDRLVKRAFKELAPGSLDAEYELVTKKPITPSKSEIVSNPRARSAKLRVLQRK